MIPCFKFHHNKEQKNVFTKEGILSKMLIKKEKNMKVRLTNCEKYILHKSFFLHKCYLVLHLEVRTPRGALLSHVKNTSRICNSERAAAGSSEEVCVLSSAFPHPIAYPQTITLISVQVCLTLPHAGMR